MLSLTMSFLLAIHVCVSLLIVLIVLMQRPKSEGLGAAFGGGMTENLFGAQTTNVLANFTRWLGGIFFLLTLILSILYAKQSAQKSAIQAEALREAAMATPAASTTGTAAEPVLKLGVPAASRASGLLPVMPLETAPKAGGTSGSGH